MRTGERTATRTGTRAVVRPSGGNGGQNPWEFTKVYDLELLRPHGNLSSNDRIYRAYPGLPYNIRVAAIGGVYPYTHTLSNAPSGMTINEVTGEINWANPQSDANNITVRVTDHNGEFVEGTWSINVTTTGFVFMAGTGSDSNNGTINSPWLTMAKLSADANSSNICYWRQGTWVGQQNPLNQDGWIGRSDNNIPHIWLGYPGEIATINLNRGNRIGMIAAVYFDDITLTNILNQTFYVAGSSDNHVFRRLTINDLDDNGQSSNVSFWRFEAGADRDHFVVQDCQLSDSEAKGMSIYWQFQMLIEDNVWNAPHGNVFLDIKEKVPQFTVRGNRFNNGNHPSGLGIMNDAAGVQTYGEWCFNYCRAPVQSQSCCRMGTDRQIGVPGRVDLYRNTFYGWVDGFRDFPGDGPYNFSNNVIINNDTGDKIDLDPVSYTVVSSVLGDDGDNVIDANGFLQGQYRDDYLGSHGWEL